MTDKRIDAAGKCDKCLGHKASLGLLINEKDQWANCPVGITATTLSYVYCRWDDVKTLRTQDASDLRHFGTIKYCLFTKRKLHTHTHY